MLPFVVGDTAGNQYKCAKALAEPIKTTTSNIAFAELFSFCKIMLILDS